MLTLKDLVKAHQSSEHPGSFCMMVECAACGKKISKIDKSERLVAFTLDLLEDGWTAKNAKSLCPECTAEHKKEENNHEIHD